MPGQKYVQSIGGKERKLRASSSSHQALLVLVNRGMWPLERRMWWPTINMRMGNWISSSSLWRKEIIKDSYGKPIRELKRLVKRSMSVVSRTMMSLFGSWTSGDWENLLAVTLAVTLPSSVVKSSGSSWRPAVIIEAGRALVSYQGISRKSGPISTTDSMMLCRFLGKDQTTRMMGGVIEIAPLAYMQVRTLDDALSSSMKRKTPSMQMKMTDPVLVLTLRWLSMEC